MAGESILIVDDTPVSLKLTRILLVSEGYKVLAAGSAEEALDLLRGYHPSLVLADVQLPGIDGLELTRRIKHNEKTRDITVVALTAYAMKGDEQRAITAGCDGYITKPIDTRTLGQRIKEFLVQSAETRVGAAPPPAESDEGCLPVVELYALRRRFLEEGQEQVRKWLAALDGDFRAAEVSAAVHQWIGAAGLLGYTALTRLARELEATLRERPVDQSQLRESLTSLALAFSSPREARDLPVPEPLRQALHGVRVALAGLPAADAERLSVALERADAIPVPLPDGYGPDSDLAGSCAVAVVHVCPEARESPWLVPAVLGSLPILLMGQRDHLLALDQQVQSLAQEFLMDGWQPEEAWVRISHALDRRTLAAPTSTATAAVPAALRRIVIADDDPTVRALVTASLRNFGMECKTVSDGEGAYDAIRRLRPAAAVLDVNMPGMDGYQVLAAIREEQIPVHIVLLTARQQECDVLRGFALGADDYVVKPFSPPELVARLKRLLR